MHEIFIEAESFENLGGWVVDTDSFETLGSSYIMAHGLGVPVEDATTRFNVPKSKEYRIFVYTRDWNKVFGIGSSAGVFSLLVDDVCISEKLGTESTHWHWQNAGSIYIPAGEHKLSLHDLTGFNGRADAIYMTDSNRQPDDISVIRSRFEGETKICEKQYDLIVAGGGIAGICTAISAMRKGIRVLLIHDRSILGGCNSSEVRVCMGGQINLPPYENLGNVVREIEPIIGYPDLFEKEYYEDNRKLLAFKLKEHPHDKCDIVLNSKVVSLNTEGKKILSVVATDTLTGKKTVYSAKLFSDCTGDAVLARLAGCEVMYGRDSYEEYHERLAPPSHENLVMGHSLRWYTEKNDTPCPFPKIDWALPFDEQHCFHSLNGDWEQETGFRRDMVKESEYIRDYGLLSIFSNWNFQKNISKRKEEYSHYSLKWISASGGKRESYRVKGDVVLTENDIDLRRDYEDKTASVSWNIDIHFPEPDNEEFFGEAFRSFAYHQGIEKAYPVPYRCLYAKDADNLFLGGRIVSMTHVAFSSVRVMRTLGMLGEAAGLAAALCIEKCCTPREIYTDYLNDYQSSLAAGVPVFHAFQCGTGAEEAYHFKDIGWIFFNPPPRCDSVKDLDKYKRNIEKLGLTHKYPKNYDDFK